MKLTMKLMTALCAGVLFFAACKKDKKDDPTPVTKTQQDHLIDGKWQMTSFKTVTHWKNDSLGFDTTMTDENMMEACEKDNFMTFVTGGKIYFDEGTTKCDPTDPQVDSASTWTLSSDYKTLTITESGTPQVFTIDELTASLLKMSMKSDDSDGMGGTMNYTLTISAKNIK